MPVVSLDNLRFSGLAWPFKLLPSKHRVTSILFHRSIRVIEDSDWFIIFRWGIPIVYSMINKYIYIVLKTLLHKIYI